MKRLNILIALLLSSLVFSCSPSNGDNSDNSDIDNSSSDTNPSSEGGSDEEHKLSSLNPMNEPYLNRQFYLNHIGDIYNTWKSYQGDGVTVAVIDVGFMYNHPDFTYEDGSSKVSKKSAYFSTNGTNTTTNVGTQYLSNTISAHGYNNDHGTFCAGVAAAGINGKGVMGIAPLSELLLLRTDGQAPSINAAFRYAADNGARVVTISIGSYNGDYDGDLNYDSSPKADLSTVFNDAVSYCRNKGTVVVSAAGNGGGGARATEYTYPGGTTGVIGAGGLAANSSNTRWEGSSYNSSSQYMFCDVFAPSQGMFGCCEYNSSKYDGGSDEWKGTSFASPIVAGLAALYFEKNPNNTVNQFENDLYASCVSFGSDSQNGHGRVDVGKLMSTTSTGNIAVKAKDTEALYAYVWNSVTGVSEKAWPGNACSISGGNYIYTVDTSKYDSVIFNNNNGAQTIDLTISSFINGNVYDTSSPIEFSTGKYIGKYLKN